MTVHECVYAAIPAGKPAETTVSGTGNILPSAGTGELSESSELVEKSANEPGFSPRENSPAGIAGVYAPQKFILDSCRLLTQFSPTFLLNCRGFCKTGDRA